MAIGVGIDVGSRTTRAAKLVCRRGIVRWAGCVRFKPGSKDPLHAQLREAGIPLRGVVAGISGKDVLLRYSRVPPAPPWKLRMLVGYDATQGGELDASFSYRLLNLPVRADSNDLAVLTAVAKNDALTACVESLARDGIKDAEFVPDALALYEIFSRCPETDEALDRYCLVLDIGATKTEMAIVYNRGLIFARSIAFGGRDFTRVLAEALGMDTDSAERLKRKEGAVLDEDEIALRPAAEQPMLRALSHAAEEFLGAIRASLMFARAQTRLVDLEIGRVYVSGSGARLAGLTGFLTQRLGATATPFGPPDDWGVPAEPGQPSEWMIALGLALTALRPPEERMSLLPPRERKRREFRRRHVFAWAACALFVVAAAAAAATHVHNWAVAKATLRTREQLRKDAAERDAELAALIEGNRLRRERLGSLESAAQTGAHLARLVAFVHENRPGPVVLSSMEFLPGDLNHAGSRSSLVLIGSVGASTRPPRVVLDEFSDRLKTTPWFDPPDPENRKIIRQAPEPAPGRPLEFEIEMPLRLDRREDGSRG